jgi:Zn-dependent metalloprotease
MTHRCSLHCILPPSLLHKLAANGSEEVRKTALETLALDHRFRLARAEAAARTGGRLMQPVTFARQGGKPQRTIYDQHEEEAQAPGTVARSEGQEPVEDPAVNQAYDGLGATYDYYWSLFQRDSIDGQGLPLLGLIHFGVKYPNAMWDNAGHMFFGDGDGKALTQTTAGTDVIGHELTHGVTQYEANLVYSGQSGALNESVSDVFGIQIKQRVKGESAADSNWLIGEEIVGPELKPALRSMANPGSANQYDDQPANMDDYVAGGDVHTNSGIPNHAFYVVATTLGGNSWEAAGRIWYAALCDPSLPGTATFSEFAKRTAIQAERAYGAKGKEAEAVRAGWDAVKVPL